MIKYLFTCLLLLTGLLAIAQPKRSVVNLVQSDRAQGIKRNGEDVIKVYNGVFKQDYSTLRSDSAYFYPQKNGFDAFGHVNINQGDTLNIYSDKLNYNGNTHVALLTDNVKLVDKDATLTTNYLTYNTATRIGTYTGGGKLVNKDNTLTSTNGYYFAFTRDSYFRYNVVLKTVDALIKTDTLRYNTGSRIAYFYGPTHIYGKKNDTLYTENGTYNTVTEQAFFGKKNRYTQDTKMLKGDSLFYDRVKGYGRAVKNVIFDDSEQKITLHGQLGTYYGADQRTVVTINPWVTIITEEKDSTKTDSVAKKPEVAAKHGKSKQVAKLVPNTMPLNADSKAALTTAKAQLPQNMPDTTRLKQTADSVGKQAEKMARSEKAKSLIKAAPNTIPVRADGKQVTDNLAEATRLATTAKTKETLKGKTKVTNVAEKADLPKDTTARVKRDTIYMVADTLETRVLTFKDLKNLQEQRRLLNDTSAAAKRIVAAARAAKNPSKFLTVIVPKIPADTAFRHRDYFGKPAKPAPRQLAKVTVKKTPGDTLKRITKTDSVNLRHQYKLSDTSHIRILTGHFNAKIYKSDLQAKADSIFYSSGDSTIRCFIKPMMWAQGSQMSGDTIYLQMKNKKLDNMDMFPNAFIVNVEEGDTTHFNQITGKKMKGYFVNNKLNRMFIDGNAQSIYFKRDSGQVAGMEKSLTSRIRINFKDNKVQNIMSYVKPDGSYGPLNKFSEDDRILKGFIWKPKDRPESKEQLIPELDTQHKYKHTAPSKVQPGKQSLAKGKATGIKPSGTTVAGKDTTGRKGSSIMSKDSVTHKLSESTMGTAKDSASSKAVSMPATKPAVKDSVGAKATTPVKAPAAKPATNLPSRDEQGRKIIRNVIIQPAPSTAPIKPDSTSKP